MTYTHNAKEQKLQAIFLALASIPAGKVISYGQLAALAGLPGGARLVGRTMSQLPEATQLPWHRVINAQGRISLPENSPGFTLQSKRLEAEGVKVTRGRVSLREFGWQPQPGAETGD